MPRYVLFVSAPTALVTNPHAVNAMPARFAGRRLRETPPSPKVLPEDEHPDLIDHYECVEEVLIDDPHLRSAAAKGDGTILYTVTTKTRAEADKLFEADAMKRAKVTAKPDSTESTAPTTPKNAAKAASNEVK